MSTKTTTHKQTVSNSQILDKIKRLNANNIEALKQVSPVETEKRNT